jgi:hypothetical protein
MQVGKRKDISMQKLIREYSERGALVAIYSNPNYPESFSLGYIIAIDNDYIILQAYDKVFHISTITVRANTIYGIEADSIYLRKCAASLPKDFQDGIKKAVSARGKQGLLFQEMRTAKDNEEVVSVELFHNDWVKTIIITGRIERLSNSIVTIEQISSKAEYDGKYTCYVDDIRGFRRNDLGDLRRYRRYLNKMSNTGG